MPEYIRSLIVILVLGSATFVFSRFLIAETIISKVDFDRRKKYWFIVTLVGFLSQTYLLFLVLLAIVLRIAYKNEKSPLALYFFLLLALPQLRYEVPGFSGVRFLFDIDYVKILSVMLLLPIYIENRGKKENDTRAYKYVDYLLIAYVLLNLVLQASYDTVFGLFRATFYWLVDILLPYYAISRGIKKLEDFKEIMASLLVAGMLVAPVGIFEFFKRWLLYSSQQEALDISSVYEYLDRGDFIRTIATSGHSIIFGYVLMVILGVFLYMKDKIRSRLVFWSALGILAAAEISTLSKGPWVGVAVLLVLLWVTGEKAGIKAFRALLVSIPVVFYLLNSKMGETIISYLPFVGTLDEGSITYRQQVAERGLEAALNHPFFGSSDYMLQLEDLRQGQGIIDLVNTYLIVALDSGLVGLSLYVGFFLSIAFLIYKNMASYKRSEDFYKLGSTLLGVLLAILVVISTVSPIFHVKIIYMSIAAFGIAYARLSSKEVRL